MVKEGSRWFAASTTAMKTQPVAVSPGATADDFRAVARQAAISAGLDPVIFERQIEAESGFDPAATSPAGARGIAQIMPTTAQSWGVDPSDPVASLHAAAHHMARYVRKYGNYPMALAAYNAGPGAVERYGGVPPFRETRNYIAKILGSS
jgi:soluble lytic murein transglycosylase-like protein